jgi:hypothetical protein
LSGIDAFLDEWNAFQYEEGTVSSKKLTPGEISSSMEKIRKRYDEYISKFFKPKSLREAFEGRYIRALRAGIDISSFLIAEISAIEELISRGEQRVMAGPPRAAEKEPSFADRILEENRKRIEKYPDVTFHNDAGEEVRRLVGALSVLEKDHWPDLTTALRDTMYAMNSAEMLALDSQLRFLASTNREEIPQFLTRLVAQLGKFPRNYAAIDREEKEYILEAGFFLNDLFTVLERVQRVYTEMGAQEKRILDAKMSLVWELINDFRLKDFKRRRRWDREES